MMRCPNCDVPLVALPTCECCGKDKDCHAEVFGIKVFLCECAVDKGWVVIPEKRHPAAEMQRIYSDGK